MGTQQQYFYIYVVQKPAILKYFLQLCANLACNLCLHKNTCLLLKINILSFKVISVHVQILKLQKIKTAKQQQQQEIIESPVHHTIFWQNKVNNLPVSNLIICPIYNQCHVAHNFACFSVVLLSKWTPCVMPCAVQCSKAQIGQPLPYRKNMAVV